MCVFRNVQGSESGTPPVVPSALRPEKCYQFVVIDAEGDYENFTGVVTVGSRDHEPDVEEILKSIG